MHIKATYHGISLATPTDMRRIVREQRLCRWKNKMWKWNRFDHITDGPIAPPKPFEFPGNLYYS